MLIKVSGVEKFLWTTCMITDTSGGPPLTYGQQTAGASSEDNTGQYIDKEINIIND